MSHTLQNKAAHFQVQSSLPSLGHIKAAIRKQWVLIICTRFSYFDSLGFSQGLQDFTQFMGFRLKVNFTWNFSHGLSINQGLSGL